MILKNNKKTIIKYIIYISILYLSMFVLKEIFYQEEDIQKDVVTSTIVFNNDKMQINVEYPRFKNDELNRIVSNKVFSYVKKFKSSPIDNKILNIDYDLYYFDEYINVVFNIDNTLSSEKYSNILLNTSKKSISYISDIYDKDYLLEEVNNQVNKKYYNDVYEKIKKSNINNHTYLLSENYIYIYFNDIDFSELDYIPYVSINLIEETFEISDEYDSSQKYVSFTFDDGPAKYTSEILDTLQLYNSSATFFMIGSLLDSNKDVVNKIYNSNSEIGMHSYYHRNYSLMNKEEINNEIDMFNEVYFKITGGNINLLRPPYGNIENTDELNYPLILWNVDPKDWLIKDSNKIYNNVIKNISDGSIVVFHDNYKETLEAIKMLLPQLDQMGYKVVSITKLSEIKNTDLKNKKIIYSIK